MSLLRNPKFKNNAKHYGQLLTDTLVPPLEKAVYHVEYLIRHKGAPHLKPAHRHLNWLQYHSVDVIAFLVLVPVLFFIALTKIIFSCCCSQIKKVKLS